MYRYIWRFYIYILFIYVIKNNNKRKPHSFLVFLILNHSILSFLVHLLAKPLVVANHDDDYRTTMIKAHTLKNTHRISCSLVLDLWISITNSAFFSLSLLWIKLIYFGQPHSGALSKIPQTLTQVAIESKRIRLSKTKVPRV